MFWRIGETIRGRSIPRLGSGVLRHDLKGARIYASQQAVANAEIKQQLDDFVMLLDSVLKARERVMMDLNVAQTDLAAVIECLPSMRRPTVSPLSDSGWVAIRSAVPRKQMAELVPQLKAAGACDIVITAAEQLIP